MHLNIKWTSLITYWVHLHVPLLYWLMLELPFSRHQSIINRGSLLSVMDFSCLVLELDPLQGGFVVVGSQE